MKIVILGGDGYLGWPTSMSLAMKDHDVVAVDNYLRRRLALETNSEALIPNPNLVKRAEIFKQQTGKEVSVEIGDCCDYNFISGIFERHKPDAVIHYAEQPAAPYGMKKHHEAHLTLHNNIGVTLNTIWAVLENCPHCHIIKLGTMGEYGTPNIDIEEGWIDINHKGREHKFLYPRQSGSLYHTTKIMDTDLLWFYVRTYGINVTDLMQGPVYGLSTPETDIDDRLLPNFHYDDIFGTVVNRFITQAVAGVPLTVFGKGGQTRGYLDINDTLQCVELSLNNPVTNGELRIFNQFMETLSVNEIAEKIKNVGNGIGLNVDVQPIPNPRKELEEHYYNPSHQGLLELGLKPHYLTDDVIENLLKKVKKYERLIDRDKILPRIKWK